MADAPENVGQLETLPDELREFIELQKLKRLAHIDGLAKVISEKRDEAVAARLASGIEKIWREDREYYLGIDDANRATADYTKSQSLDGGLSSNKGDLSGVTGATAFFNITRQFVDSASARMGDILLPAGEWNFSVAPTEVPELEKIKGSSQPVKSPLGNVPRNEDGTVYTLGQFAVEEMADVSKKVEKAETQIKDWLTECNFVGESRKVIEDSAQIGTGVFRGAYPIKKKSRIVLNGKLSIEDKIIPASKRVDPVNFFPDPSCGDNIQNGGYCIERDYLTARQLRDLKGIKGYIDENIDKVLKEGPEKIRVNNNSEIKDVGNERYQVWYFFGDMSMDDLDAFGAGVNKDDDPNRSIKTIPAVGVMINDTLIKGYVNPLDNGEFPYDVMPWQRVNGSIWGVGVSRQGRIAQEMLNAGGRSLMNNMGISSAPQIVIRQGAITPVDGSWAMVGGKFWYAMEGSDMRTVSDAFTIFNIPSMQVEMEKIMQMATKMMEDATGVSFLLQGQQGSAPDTVGGMELLHKNSSALLRRIARVYDECVTVPHINRYYDWVLIHCDDEMKGDLQIKAIGSSALVEREIQAMQVMQILEMANNPAYEMSPKKAKDEVLRAWRFEPSKFDMSDEEKEAAKNAQPAPPPQIAAAQIRAQSAEKIAIERIKHEQQTTAATLDHEEQMDANDTDRDTVYVQSQTARDQLMYQSKVQEFQLRKELAMMEYANAHQMSLEAVRAKLTETAMKLNVQKELTMQSLAQDTGKHAQDAAAKTIEVVKPAAEPTGQARAGHSFTE